MPFKVVEELQVQVRHEIGALAGVLGPVAKAGVDVKAFVAYGMGPDMAFVHFVPSNIKKARAALKKAGCKIVGTNKVVAGPVKDKRGSAAAVAQKAAAAGINMEAIYATGTGKGSGVIVIAVTNPKDVTKLVRALE